MIGKKTKLEVRKIRATGITMHELHFIPLKSHKFLRPYIKLHDSKVKETLEL